VVEGRVVFGRFSRLVSVALLLVGPAAGDALAGEAAPVSGPFRDWKHAGSLFLLTTPEGADLPASAVEHDFPVLVRLHRDFFDFGQADPGGADIRFSTPAGVPLAYQVEAWDAAGGTASIWVRVPEIRGNARQEIRLHWGRPGAASASDGTAVFGAFNGYLGVWHMNDPVRDEVGRWRRGMCTRRRHRG
jgi:hypothetical protein